MISLFLSDLLRMLNWFSKKQQRCNYLSPLAEALTGCERYVFSLLVTAKTFYNVAPVELTNERHRL